MRRGYWGAGLVFDLGLDEYDHDVGSRAEAWGKVFAHRVVASDGTGYNVNLYVPDNPLQGSIPVTFTTPWFTDLEGFNDHIGGTFAREGMITIAVGPEQRDIGKAIRRIGQASLAHDAEVHHLILDQLGVTSDIDLAHTANFGYSRGAMVGFGLQAYAGTHNRKILYSEYIDPCLAQEVTPKEVPWVRLYPYALKELGALALATRYRRGRTIFNLIPTIVRPPGFWVSQISTGIALFSGQAGEFIDHVPQESKTHVTLFKGSLFNQANVWKELLADFPNVTIDERCGTHFSGSDMHIIKGAIKRVKAAQPAE